MSRVDYNEDVENEGQVALWNNAVQRAINGSRGQEPPLIDKSAIIADLKAVGIEPPRLYRLGFPHNNCGGGCVRAGQGHFTHLLKTLPDVYAEWEKNEEEVRTFLGKDVSILKSRIGGTTTTLTLAEHRHIYETRPQQLDLFEWGGCGCFLEEEG